MQTQATMDRIDSALSRERHFPRLCPDCASPMARQEETCWHCVKTGDAPAQRS